jgi:predicted CoA-binding protein
MNASIQDFITGKRIAIAGASRSPGKFGNAAGIELKARGYEVFLVHPEALEIDGQPCYPSLAALPEKVDGVLVSVPPSKAGEVMRQASAAGVQNVWLQAGAETPELLDLGKELGLNLVSGKCILMYAQPVRSVHLVHRWVCKLTGQL